ncbi:Hypothetical predicted protein [Paramuricea clavata]|uniref:Uncharacterized protein n=1 Tax=Paramuricea clavata TaxID=317549 RepID=A0A6S7IYK4_PARCT|nr:Hypothetical predicted protein [Paramuricea clavata]
MVLWLRNLSFVRRRTIGKIRIRPTLSYEETVTAGQQLDLAGQISSSQSVINEVTTSGGTNQTVVDSPLVTQWMESVDILTRRVSELSQSVANVNAASAK